MVDLVLVEAHAADEVDLDLVAGGDAADQVVAGGAAVLGDGDDRRDVVAGVGVLGGEEGVVEVEFADGGAVGQGGPLGGVGARHTEDPGAPLVRGVGGGLPAGDADGAAEDGGGGHRGVVDDPVDDHLPGVVRDLHRVGRHFGDPLCEVFTAGELLRGTAGADFDVLHVLS